MLVVEIVKDLEGKDLFDKVIVINLIDEMFVFYVEKVLGLIIEENGIILLSVIVGLEKGILIVVGVEKVVKNISNNMLVMIDVV